jgi:hypothetical protein
VSSDQAEQYRAAAERLLSLPANEFRQGLQALLTALREDDFTRTADYPHRTTLRRTWFRDADGTYYRNCPLINAEQWRLSSLLLPWRFRALSREWWHVYREGLLRTRTIGRYDRVATPAPFSEAYPDKPGLWLLDDYREA